MLIRRRVVVTGLGIVAPGGIGREPFWSSLVEGRSGIGRITLFDAAAFPGGVAAEVTGFRLQSYYNGRYKPARLGRQTQLAMVAHMLAVEDAGLTPDIVESRAPVPVVMGVSSGSVEMIARCQEVMQRRGPSRVSPYGVEAYQPHAISCMLAEMMGVETRAMTVSSGCAAGLDAIAVGASMISSGRANLVITGGADAPINRLTIASLASANMVPDETEDPTTVSRPFDLMRRGGIPAEGACVVILESLEHAVARGARPVIEIGGHGANHDRKGAEPGAGLALSMQIALANARCRPSHVDYVCAAGPSDPVLDRTETAAIKGALGRHAYQVPVSSIKGVIGNPLAAAGPLQLATCAMAMCEGIVPPTANYQYPDPECDLDYVPDTGRAADIGTALINVHGLGGADSSMVVSRPGP